MIAALSLLVASAFLVFLSLGKRDRKIASLGKLPGPPGLPVIGAMLDVINLPIEGYFEYTLYVTKRFGERLVAHLFGFYFVLLSNPDDIEKILTSTTNIRKGTSYKFFRPWLGDSLFMSTGQKWQKRRKLLTSAFHYKILETFYVIYNEQSNVLVNVMRKDFSNGIAKDICPYLSRCALDIIGETAMGIPFDTQRQKITSYSTAVETACKAMMYRAPRPLIWPDFIFYLTPYGRKYKSALKTLHSFTDEVIKTRKAATRPVVIDLPTTDPNDIYVHEKRRLAFLDLLLQAQRDPVNQLTDLDIREEVDVFMFGGHDTSSVNLSWTIFLLGSYPKYQSLLHEELDRIFGADKTRPVTSKDLTEMKYLEMCIKESFRLYPVAAILSRTLTSDILLDPEVTLPSGCDVIVNVLGVQRNEEIYPNPTEYLPDRFLPENMKNRHPFAFLPFSAGPRNCIGQKFAMTEMKVILANLFRNFTVEAAEPLENVVVMIEAVTRPRDGLKVKLHPR